MNTFALAEEKELGTLSGTATRCIICVEVSLRSFFHGALKVLHMQARLEEASNESS